MFIKLTMIICAVHIIAEKCKCVKLSDLPSDSGEPNSIDSMKNKTKQIFMQFAPVNITNRVRRRMPKRVSVRRQMPTVDPYRHLKALVRTLVDQAILDTNRTLQSMRTLRNNMKQIPDYKIGFITSFIRKERQQMNDFFEMALKFKDHVKVLQQMKVFEYIMRSNVNITTLVRQLIHLHIERRENLTTTRFYVPDEPGFYKTLPTASVTSPTPVPTAVGIEEGPPDTRTPFPAPLLG